jgi:hypothetical protein
LDSVYGFIVEVGHSYDVSSRPDRVVACRPVEVTVTRCIATDIVFHNRLDLWPTGVDFI